MSPVERARRELVEEYMADVSCMERAGPVNTYVEYTVSHKGYSASGQISFQTTNDDAYEYVKDRVSEAVVWVINQ